MKNVEFVSYTGKWPNLCRGILTLNINGKEVKFGKDYNTNEEYLDKFWCSGGNCGFSNGKPYCNSGEWLINEPYLPEEYREYADEIAKVMNDNIKHGCCGGCL